MLPEDIKLKLDSLSRPAWRPRPGPAVPGAVSKFGGLPLLRHNEPWPCCGHCHQPMQLFLQLDSTDLPGDAKSPFGKGLLQVFYCTNGEEDCEVLGQAHLPFSEASLVRVIPHVHAHREARPVNIPDAFAEQSLTGWIPLRDFPDPQEAAATHKALADESSAPLSSAQCPAPRSGDKLSGWPHWIAHVDYPSCHCCREPMRFVMQLDSADCVPFRFGNYGCAYIFQCERHPNIMTLSWESRD